MAPDPVSSLEQLAELYGEPVPTSLTKEVGHLTAGHQRFIERAPFLVLASSGPDGIDCSPRGDPAPLVRTVDANTILLPDRRGNNRLDSLRNMVLDPRVALLFLVPGIGTTLRVNGTARLLVDDELRASFAIGDRLPTLVIEVTAERVYTQCPKALVRSKLWDPDGFVDHADVPTVGEIMEEITEGELEAGPYDAAYPERLRQTLY